MADYELINKMNYLAKIKVSEAEREDMVEYMEGILDYVKILDEVDIRKNPIDTIEAKGQILRKDYVESSYKAKDLLENAPSTKEDFILVPNILD